MTRIDLSDVIGLEASDLEAVTNNLRDIEVYKLGGCSSINNAIMKTMAHRTAFLEVLEVTHCDLITDEAMVHLARQCGRLTRLDISHCFRITDFGIQRVSSHCDNLRELVIRHVKFITDESIASLAQGCPKLELLDATWCVHITSRGLKRWAESAPIGEAMKVLILRNCTRVNDDGILAVAKAFTALERLDIAHCTLCTDKSLKKVPICLVHRPPPFTGPPPFTPPRARAHPRRPTQTCKYKRHQKPTPQPVVSPLLSSCARR